MLKQVIQASSLLVGTIIGVGIFGMPYVASQSGFLVAMFYLAILGLVAITVHLFYAKIVLVSGDGQRMIGHIRQYLGSRWGVLASVTVTLTRLGALLVYIVVSGHFLSTLLGGSSTLWSLAFFALGALAVFFGLKTIALIEVLLSLFLLASILLIFGYGLPQLEVTNLTTFNFSHFFLPYGVVLFSLGGVTAIADMELIAKKNKKPKKTLYLSVIIGTVIAILVTVLFTLAVLGVTGGNTTPEALAGLKGVLNDRVVAIGLIFGVVALFTSFLTIGLNLKKILQLDFKLNQHLAWGLACFTPLLLFLLGLTDFIGVMGIVGALFGAMTPVYISLIFSKIEPRLKSLSYLVVTIFVLGGIYEVVRSVL
jgi:tyrosine-specific transport protein